LRQCERTDELNTVFGATAVQYTASLSDVGDFGTMLLDGFLDAGDKGEHRSRTAVACAKEADFGGIRRRHRDEFDIAVVRSEHWPDALERAFKTLLQAGLDDAKMP